MKKIIAITVLATCLYSIGNAQERKTRNDKRTHFKREIQNYNPEEVAKIRTDRLDKKLNFSESQKQEIYNLELDKAKRHKEVKEKQKLMREELRKDHQADREAFQKLLSPEQQKLLKEKEKIAQDKKGKFKRNQFKSGKKHRFRSDRMNKTDKKEAPSVEEPKKL